MQSVTTDCHIGLEILEPYYLTKPKTSDLEGIPVVPGIGKILSLSRIIGISDSCI